MRGAADGRAQGADVSFCVFCLRGSNVSQSVSHCWAKRVELLRPGGVVDDGGVRCWSRSGAA